MNAKDAAIEDNKTPKAFDDPTLSPRAKAIAKRAAPAHVRLGQLATWARSFEGRDPKTVKFNEVLALKAFEDLRKKLTWPVWSTSQSDTDVKAQMFAIQATHQRVNRLAPTAFLTPPA